MSTPNRISGKQIPGQFIRKSWGSFVLVLLLSCQPSGRPEGTGRGDAAGPTNGREHPKASRPDADGIAREEMATTSEDSLYLRLAGSEESEMPLHLTAGKAAGTLELKAPSDSLFARFGKPDSVAVDMCKDLSYWYSDEALLGVYSLCDNDLDMRKSVRMILLSGYPFSTGAGVTDQSDYQTVRQSYPGALPIGTFTRGEQKVVVVDDAKKGITFELSDTTGGHCTGVVIHPAGEAVTASNIPLYPGLEKF